MPIFDPAIFDPAIFDVGGGSPIPFPAESGLSPVILTVAGVAVPHDFTMQTEEVLGGVGAATFRVQDRLLSAWEPVTHQEVIATVRDSGWRLFKGEIANAAFSLPVGFPFRVWTLTCHDYNVTLDEKLMGAPNGLTFVRETTEDAYRPVDGLAVSSSTDEVTVQAWLDIYHRLPGGFALNDTTYVFEYIDIGVLGQAPYVINLFEAQTTLRAALETMASIADVNVQFWIDPDDNFHWQAIPAWQDLVGNSDPTDLDAAPYALVDESAANGTTTLGHQDIQGGFDGSAQPEVVYVQGANTYIRLASGDRFGQGSGWVPEAPDYTAQRQVYLSAPGSWTAERRDAVAASALARGLLPTLRGSVGVRGYLVDGAYESRDGWRVGQLLPISDARLPASLYPGGRFVIQRVVATIYPGTRMLHYQLDIGDGPTGRMSTYAAREVVQVKPGANRPTTEWVVDVLTDLSPFKADEVRTIVFMPRAGDNTTWGENGIGVPMSWRVEARDADGTVVPAMGSFSPEDAVTDADGKLRTVFTAGSQEGLVYEVWVVSIVAP